MHTPGCGCVNCEPWAHFDPKDCPFCNSTRVYRNKLSLLDEVVNIHSFKVCECVAEMAKQESRKPVAPLISGSIDDIDGAGAVENKPTLAWRSLIWGPTGSNKTTAMINSAIEALKDKKQIRIITSTREFSPEQFSYYLEKAATIFHMQSANELSGDLFGDRDYLATEILGAIRLVAERKPGPHDFSSALADLDLTERTVLFVDMPTYPGAGEFVMEYYTEALTEVVRENIINFELYAVQQTSLGLKTLKEETMINLSELNVNELITCGIEIIYAN